VLPKAFLKMIDTYAKFSPNAMSVPVKISGMECTASYSVDNSCAQSKPSLLGGLFKTITCLKCLLGKSVDRRVAHEGRACHSNA
jgi:hypothetical protein